MIPYSAQRVIWDDNGTETDVTEALNNYETLGVTFAYTTAQDALYIASDMPFNHKFIEVGATPNAVASTVSVAIWFGNQWVDAVDVRDGTAVAGASLGQSGVIRWSTNRIKSWDREQDSEDVTGVSTVGIYDMYWARLTWSATLTAGTILNYMGHKFCNDEQLATEYPNTRNSSLKYAFATSKADWNDQHYAAAEDIIQDLQNGNVIISGSQIVDPEYYMEAAKHRAAMLIYSGLEGEGYAKIYEHAAKEYAKAIKKSRYRVDADGDGRLSDTERRIVTKFMGR